MLYSQLSRVDSHNQVFQRRRTTMEADESLSRAVSVSLAQTIARSQREREIIKSVERGG